MSWEDLVDQSHLEGPLGRQTPTGIGHFTRNAIGNDFWEALQRTDIGGHSDVDFLNHKERIC
jgi:hypothetical protein